MVGGLAVGANGYPRKTKDVQSLVGVRWPLGPAAEILAYGDGIVRSYGDVGIFR